MPNADDLTVFQGWLDEMADATFRDDFATFRDGIELPFVLVTSSGTMISHTEEDIRAGFDAFRRMLVTLQATQMVRVAEDVVRIAPGTLVGWYETHILRGGHRLFEPFRSSMTLRRSGNAWRAVTITNGMRNESWPINLLELDGTEPGVTQ